MNNGLFRWLLDVDRIPADAQDVSLAWQYPLPLWVWLIIIIAAIALAFWSYSRLAGNTTGRRILAVVRSLALLLLVVILCGPMLELKRETVEQDWLLVLADRSESMQIADAPTDASAGQRFSRDRQLRTMLDRSADTWTSLDESRELVWLGFHDGVFDLANSTDAATNGGGDEANDRKLTIDLGSPDGQRTNLNAALEQALQRAAARPISGIVIMSDGRTVDAPARSLIRRLKADQIKVFTLPLGSDEPLGDMAVARIDAPRRAFVRDKVPIIVELDRFGEAVREIDSTVKLTNTETGETLDEVEFSADENTDAITLTAEPDRAGEANWQVEIITDRPDLVPDNNVQPLQIELIDRPLRVLYAEGYPRWEYHFLKGLLIQEDSIESSILLISADREFAQEGDRPLTRLPNSPEEFAEFDVIVLGDIPGNYFSPSQLEMMRDHVSERGAGFLWIGGMKSTPSTYIGTAATLADLLPIRAPLNLPRIDEPVNMVPTALAERLGVLRMVSAGKVGWPIELADPEYRWSQLTWAQRIDPRQLKPTAQALAVTATEFDGSPLPLVMHMRYGSGQVIYVATDEIWRWRYGRGSLLPEQFWVQMIRMLGRETLAGGDEPAILEVDPRRLSIGQPMQISLRLLDARLVDLGLQSIRATLEDSEGNTVAELELRPLDADKPDEFATTWLPDTTGQFRVRIEEPLVSVEPLVADVEVISLDNELRRPETDHALLASLSEETGGRVLSTHDLSQLPDLLPNRSKTIPNPLTERIWDTPLAFLLVLLLLTCEWIGRKVLRLA